MKSQRSVENLRAKDQKIMRLNQLELSNPNQFNKNLQSKMAEFDNIAKKAKEQLKQLDSKKKNSPEQIKYKITGQNNTKNNYIYNPTPTSAKSSEYSKGLTHHYSQKYFKNQNIVKDMKNLKVNQHKKEKAEGENPLLTIQQKNQKKKQPVSTSQYKKLHEKLDSIENKITDMKKNLEKKRQQKQKHIQTKIKLQKQAADKKHLSLNGLVTQVPQHAQLHTFNTNPYSPRHNVYYVSQLVRAINDQKSLARQHLVTSLNILRALQNSKKPSEQEIQKFKLNLPRKKHNQGKKTIVFDLDQTLIHCNQNLNMPHDVKLPIKFPTGEVIQAGINIRPYAREILKNLSKNFEIIVFTASHSCYANVVIDYLDANNEWVSHRLFRQNCYLSPQGLYIKDLRVINRDLKQLILVDNAAYSYAYQLQNGVPILPYYHGQIDFQLKMLEDYLIKMTLSKDIREINNNTFKLNKYKLYYNAPEKLVDQLYLNK